MNASIAAVVEYLDRFHPEAAAVARERYGCLTPWAAPSGYLYGRAALTVNARTRKCECSVLLALRDLLNKQLEYEGLDRGQLPRCGAERAGSCFVGAIAALSVAVKILTHLQASGGNPVHHRSIPRRTGRSKTVAVERGPSCGRSCPIRAGRHFSAKSRTPARNRHPAS